MFIHASMIHIFMNICMVLNNSDKLYTIEFGFTRGLCLLPILLHIFSRFLLTQMISHFHLELRIIISST